MSKLVFKEMQKGDASDLATIAIFFGQDECDYFKRSTIGCCVGFRDGSPVVGSSYEPDYSHIYIDAAYENEGLYLDMLTEVVRMATNIGTAAIRTGMNAIEDLPEFISACEALGFRGDGIDMSLILDNDKYQKEENQYGKVHALLHRVLA